MLYTSIVMNATGGNVSFASISFRYSLAPSYRDELLALFKKKWGEPTPDGATRDLADKGTLLAYPPTPSFIPVVEDPGAGTLYLELRAPGPTKPAGKPAPGRPAASRK
jgi:hypothetical protein